MKRLFPQFTAISLIICLILTLTVMLPVPQVQGAGATGPQEFAPDHILVKFKVGALANTEQEVHARNHGTVIGNAGPGIRVVKIPTGKALDEVAAYRKENSVEIAEPDYIVKALATVNDTFFSTQWGLTTIQAPQAWNITTSNASVVIAVLDTGIDQNHPDLAAKIVSNHNATNMTSYNDTYGHGTHVAGIAAAITNNGIGVAGTGYKASLMNVKVLGDNGTGYTSWVIDGINWAASHGARVINMSLGGGGPSTLLEDAINNAWAQGVVVVTAAGNDGLSTPFYPAYYTNCIAVAATDNTDAKAGFSNYGDWVDVAAPGVDISSTYAGSSYVYMSGTSMAAPFVSGLAALIWATPFGTNASSVRARIEHMANNISGTGTYWHYGRINAFGSTDMSPNVTSGPVAGIGVTSVALNGTLINLDGASSVNVSFQWGTVSGNLTNETTRLTMNSTGPFQTAVSNLTANTTYYFRAKAVGFGTGYGNESSVHTLPVNPVMTDGVNNIHVTSANITGHMDYLGIINIVSLQWRTVGGNYSAVNETIPSIMLNGGSFSGNASELSGNTTYYFRAKATVDGILYYGNEQNFTSLVPYAPTVVTMNATSINAHNATLSGNLGSLGTASSAFVAFQWGTDSGNLTDETVAQMLAGIGNFTMKLTGLTGNTTYYFRAKAVGDGTAYGNETSFITANTSPPQVNTGNATSVGAHNATLSGNLSSVGTSNSVNVTFQWGTTSGNLTNATTVQVLTGTGSFTANLTGLTGNTTYFFRAKAVGDLIAYGNETSFITTDPSPSVATRNTLIINSSNATLFGTVLSLGAASSLNVTFLWGNVSGMPANETEPQLMWNSGNFSAVITGLLKNTTYYFRAKAAGDGTALGNETSFTTANTDPPIVATRNATNVNKHTVTLVGTLYSFGTASSVNATFQWRTSSGNYGGTNETSPLTIVGPGNVVANVTGLLSNTTYYFRVKVTGDGTAYGDEVGFTTRAGTANDFDGDGKTDTVVWRPSDGRWYILGSTGTFVAPQWGLSTDNITPGDYDGDGKTDIAVWRQAEGRWYILASSQGFMSVQWGLPTDIPVPGDYDGDGKSDFAVWRPSDGRWYILSSNGTFIAPQWGLSTDIPVPGDYDGDGKTDIAVWRPSEGRFYILSSNRGFLSVQWGLSTDVPVPGDYDGDGKTDFAVWRPSNGIWYILTSNGGIFIQRQWGISTDVPVPGDYDGDGKTDTAVWRPSDGRWYILSSNGTFMAPQWGLSTDIPVLQVTANR